MLAQLSLEELAAPANASLAHATGLISSRTVDALRSTGLVVLEGVLERSGLDGSRLCALISYP